MKRIVAVIITLSIVAVFTAAVSRAVLAAETAKTDASAVKADTSAAKTAAADVKKSDASAKAKTKAKKPAAPADRVVVMYFHRTQRCPTCRKMGSYTEEAVKSGFAKLVKLGKVEFHFVDFQDKKNARIAAGYEVKGPTLIVAKVAKNKVVKFGNLEEMWTKVGDKEEFIAYVQGNVKRALK
jgi:thiol-disulfide isomerase/thioredoxin